jgi:dihydrofolate reductase
MISLIVAKAANHVIGNKNDLPWYMPADLKRFKDITTGHTVIMGRKTYDSVLARRHGPLPNRRNIVVSRHLDSIPEGFELAHSLEEALALVDKTSEAFVIGGATLFAESITKKLIDKIYLTQIDADIQGDTYFPELNMTDWKEVSKESHNADAKNPYAYTYRDLERR